MTTTRPARATDAPAIAALLFQLGYPAEVDSIPGRLARLRGESSVLLLACDDRGGVVGLASVRSSASIQSDAPVAYITALVTDAQARGQGIGRRMVAAIEDWACDRGCLRLSVTSGDHRHDALAFYVGAGYPGTGRRFTKTLVEPPG